METLESNPKPTNVSCRKSKSRDASETHKRSEIPLRKTVSMWVPYDDIATDNCTTRRRKPISLGFSKVEMQPMCRKAPLTAVLLQGKQTCTIPMNNDRMKLWQKFRAMQNKRIKSRNEKVDVIWVISERNDWKIVDQKYVGIHFYTEVEN